MSWLYAILFLITAAINSAAQLLLKKGSTAASAILAGSGNWLMKLMKVFLNPFVAGAIVLLVVGMVIWIKLISKVELSRAYPVNIALTIVITSLFSIWLFHESATLIKFLGTGLIIAGLWLILNG